MVVFNPFRKKRKMEEATPTREIGLTQTQPTQQTQRPMGIGQALTGKGESRFSITDEKQGFVKRGLRGIAKNITYPLVSGASGVTERVIGRPLFSAEALAETERQLGVGTPRLKDPDTYAAIGLMATAMGGAAIYGSGIAGATMSSIGSKLGIGSAYKTGQAAKLATFKTETGKAAYLHYANNAKTSFLSLSLFKKIGYSIPAAGTILSILGSYPFAGFLKEEALQVTSMGFEGAFWNDDLEGMRNNLDMMDEILNPSTFQSLVNKIPIANVQASLWSYYKAAKIQKEVNEKRFNEKTRKRIEI